MEKVLILYTDDVKEVISNFYGVPIEKVTAPKHLQIRVSIGEEAIEDQSKAYWEVWAGWVGNHDRRIDGATCSNCGFKHPTVYGREALSQLYKTCPQCGKKMGYKEA